MTSQENSPRKSATAVHGKRRRRGEAGYSLLEVLIVLSIIALIATFVGPRLFAQLDRSKTTAARIQIQSLAAAMETLRLDIGRYPSQEEGLTILVDAPSGPDSDPLAWRGPYLDAGIPADPWGGAYQYEAPRDSEGRPRIVSYGSDRKEGGEGSAADVANFAAD
jgi:general secretion pathway protein G